MAASRLSVAAGVERRTRESNAAKDRLARAVKEGKIVIERDKDEISEGFSLPELVSGDLSAILAEPTTDIDDETEVCCGEKDGWSGSAHERICCRTIQGRLWQPAQSPRLGEAAGRSRG